MKQLEEQERRARIQAKSYPEGHPYRLKWEAAAQEIKRRREQPVELHRKEWVPLYPEGTKRRRRKK